MNTITIKDIKTRGSNAIPDDKTTYLIVNSIMKSAIVPIRDYQMYVEALEELEDIKAIESRKNEKTVSFKRIFKD